MPGLEPDKDVSTKLNRLSEIARQNPKAKFTSLAYLLTEEFLIACYRELNPQAAPGIDQVTYETYGENLPAHIADLVQRLKSQHYQATDIQRVWIPKPNGGQRPLGILILEDKIVQRGVAKILSAIYEPDFLPCSYGFRPQRSAHDALRAVELCIIKGNVNYILDIDIRGYFDNMDKGWLMRMLKERIADRTILRLIGKWLKVGILEEGKRIQSELGVPQGATLTPPTMLQTAPRGACFKRALVYSEYHMHLLLVNLDALDQRAQDLALRAPVGVVQSVTDFRRKVF